jgi:glycosyltransferase involved in cell wall biosynthesis
MTGKITVVLPARNADSTIMQTLEAIKKGTSQPDEILVVDGCSTDRTREYCQQLSIPVIQNTKLHAASARRLGIENASHQIIAFTDSDCIPSADWLERIKDHFTSDPELDGLGGRVTLTKPQTRVQAFSAHVFESIKSFPKEAVQISTKGVAGLSFAGANCAFRKDKIIAVGNFRDQFSNHGEEVDLLWRLVDAKANLVFDPLLCVEHLGYPDTINKLIHTSFRNGTTSTLLTKYHNRSPRIDWFLYKKWLHSLFSLLNPWDNNPWSSLLLLELTIFITAKWFTSLREGTINL